MANMNEINAAQRSVKEPMAFVVNPSISVADNDAEKHSGKKTVKKSYRTDYSVVKLSAKE